MLWTSQWTTAVWICMCVIGCTICCIQSCLLQGPSLTCCEHFIQNSDLWLTLASIVVHSSQQNCAIYRDRFVALKPRCCTPQLGGSDVFCVTGAQVCLQWTIFLSATSPNPSKNGCGTLWDEFPTQTRPTC